MLGAVYDSDRGIKQSHPTGRWEGCKLTAEETQRVINPFKLITTERASSPLHSVGSNGMECQ